MSMPLLKSTVFRDASIRVLTPADLPLLRDHLLRLDPDSRRDRFNGAVDGDFITRYAAGCGAQGVTVIGYFNGGEIHAAAEIHEPTRSPDQMPEVAFSVESHLRRQGVGSALFAAMLIEAKKAGYDKLRVTTGAQNCAMRALAHKFGTKLEFRHGELSGSIDVTNVRMPSVTPLPVDQEMADILIGFNHALWAPVLQMYGLAGLPKKTAPDVAVRKADGATSVGAT